MRRQSLKLKNAYTAVKGNRPLPINHQKRRSLQSEATAEYKQAKRTPSSKQFMLNQDVAAY